MKHNCKSVLMLADRLRDNRIEPVIEFRPDLFYDFEFILFFC